MSILLSGYYAYDLIYVLIKRQEGESAMKKIKAIAFFIIFTLITSLLAGCGVEEKTSFDSMDDFNEARIGIMTGSCFDVYASEYLPDTERVHCNSPADLVINLKQSKIDGILMDKCFYAPLYWDDNNLSYVEMDLPDTEYAAIFPKSNKSDKLKAELDEYIAEQNENGMLKELGEKWFSDTEPQYIPDLSKLTGENGTIRVATTADIKPFAYLKNGQSTGFDIEFIVGFAEAYGYKIELDIMDFVALLQSIEAERYDLAVASITITEERKESVRFSDPHYISQSVMAVLDEENNQSINTLDDLKGKKIAVLMGGVWDKTAIRDFPDSECKYFNLNSDMLINLQQGKVDTMFVDKTVYVNMRWENDSVDVLDEPVGQVENALIFAKENYDEKILSQVNEFIADSEKDGTLDYLFEKWFGDEEPEEHPDYNSLTGENGTIRVAVDNMMKPLSYIKNDTYTGYEVDFLTRFAEKYGYRLEIEGMAFAAVLSSVSAGKYDIGGAGITITEERKENVTFTDSHFQTDGVAVILRENKQEALSGFFDGIAESFEKAFIREDRWKLILEGLCVTLIISICSVILGTLFGFGLYMLTRSDIRFLRSFSKGFARVYSRIVAGTPVVVILMILFYVVFGKIRDISGILVAVIGFTLTFGAFVLDHMTVSVNSVDRGQTEAAYALGYTKNKTFFRVIIPQAMTIFMPSYCGQTVELIKATAVVGYIAVNDLTKMGDIIRNNTYEAFFPLIITAVIYFLITWAVSLLLKLIQIRFEPERRTEEEVLKGVKRV